MRLASLVGGDAPIVGPETAIRDVAELMLDSGTSAVAVVDRTGLIGICTDRDLTEAIRTDQPSDVPVADVMTDSPDTVTSDVTVADAASWLLETGYRHLPVVDDGELLGIVDVRDALWALLPTD
jgi:CBS domain-containing protein